MQMRTCFTLSMHKIENPKNVIIIFKNSYLYHCSCRDVAEKKDKNNIIYGKTFKKRKKENKKVCNTYLLTRLTCKKKN